MTSKPHTSPPGCPDDMACFDVDGQIALSRWIGETLLWMDQVEKACSDKETTP